MSDGNNGGPGGGHNDDLGVSVITPSGIFPSEDTLQRVASGTTITAVLHQAATALGLTNTSDWIVLQGGHQIDPNEAFGKGKLRCVVDLMWQPREGGGGA